jgi:hypothetical protein
MRIHESKENFDVFFEIIRRFPYHSKKYQVIGISEYLKEYFEMS